MRRYIRSLSDLLLIVSAVSALALLISIVGSSNESGESELDSRINSFLRLDGDIPSAETVAADIDFDEGQDINLGSLDVGSQGQDADMSDQDQPMETTSDQESTDQQEVSVSDLPEQTPAEESHPIKTGPIEAGSYEIKAGDTYGCIAEAYYGSYEHWVDVAKANTGEGFEEERLFVGNVVDLPRIEELKPHSHQCN